MFFAIDRFNYEFVSGPYESHEEILVGLNHLRYAKSEYLIVKVIDVVHLCVEGKTVVRSIR